MKPPHANRRSEAEGQKTWKDRAGQSTHTTQAPARTGAATTQLPAGTRLYCSAETSHEHLPKGSSSTSLIEPSGHQPMLLSALSLAEDMAEVGACGVGGRNRNDIGFKPSKNHLKRHRRLRRAGGVR